MAKTAPTMETCPAVTHHTAFVASEGLQLRMLELNQLFLAYEANEITVSLIRNYDCVLDTPEFLPLE